MPMTPQRKLILVYVALCSMLTLAYCGVSPRAKLYVGAKITIGAVQTAVKEGAELQKRGVIGETERLKAKKLYEDFQEAIIAAIALGQGSDTGAMSTDGTLSGLPRERAIKLINAITEWKTMGHP